MILLLMNLSLASTWDTVKDARSEEVVLPSIEDRYALRKLAHRISVGAAVGRIDEDLVATAAELRWSLRVDADTVWLIDPSEGGGIAVWRLGSMTRELVLQAPHAYADLYTGRITAALFDMGGVRAACFNTAHRTLEHGDAAHEVRSGFQAITAGIADGLTQAYVAQIHGFSSNTSKAEAVISEGPSPMHATTLRRVADRLGDALGAKTVLVGDEEPMLAARTNAQGRLIAREATFLHIELAKTHRRKLRSNDEFLAGFAEVLLDWADGRIP